MTTIYVSSAPELVLALENASGGDTIVLSDGSYGDLDLRNMSFNQAVTITSADPGVPATFSSIVLNDVDNLTFDGIEVDYQSDAGADLNLKAVQIIDSHNITIANSVFDGDLAHGVSDVIDGHGTGGALRVYTGSSNIVIDNNEFFNWHTAGVFQGVDNLTVSNNDIHGIGGDGLDFIAVDGVLIEGNYIHDFDKAEGSGHHSDMIQFWTAGQTEASRNITIRGNVLDRGAGDWTQSIFMRNEAVDGGAGGDDMYYQNILIEDNVIYNAHSHGITVGQTHGLTIQNNTLLTNEGDDGSEVYAEPKITIIDGSTSVLVGNNITPGINVDLGSGYSVLNNFYVQRESSSESNYYNDLFVNALADSGATLDDLKALPGGVIAQLGVGAALTQFETTPENLSGVILHNSGTGLDLLAQSFDSSNLFDSDGLVNGSDVTVSWDYGDGSSGTGLVSNHVYSHAGEYIVRASITTIGGDLLELSKTVVVGTPISLLVDFDSGATDNSDNVNIVTEGASVTFQNVTNGMAARLNGDVLSYAYTSEMTNNSEFTVLVDFQNDTGSGGSLITFPGSFSINVFPDAVHAKVTGDAGSEWLRADGLSINDGQWHQLALTFSGATGEAVLYVDGVELLSVSGLGSLQPGYSNQPFYIGDPWGTSFPGLIDNVAFLRGAITPEQAAGGFSAEELLAPADPFTGTSGHDTITGDDDDNTINGNDGNDWIDGGLGSDTLFGGDGDDTIVFDANDNLAALDGGAGTDTLRINGGTLPAFDLAAHGFEFAEHVQSDSASETWATKTDRYDAAWVRTRQDGVNDDGSSWQTLWDTTDSLVWSEQTTRYDAAARRVDETSLYDDGLVRQMLWDVDGSETWARVLHQQDGGNNNTWTQQWTYFDDLNRYYEQTVLYDDGRTLTSTFDVDGVESWWRQDNVQDVADAYSWTSRIIDFDDQYRRVQETVQLDDGRVWSAQLDVTDSEAWSRSSSLQDTANNFAWSEATTLFDDQGRYYEQIGTYDDGRTWQLHFDVDNIEVWSRKGVYQDAVDSQDWTERTIFYDDQNRQYDQTVIFDDGLVWRTQWDVEGAEVWSRQAHGQDTANTLVWSESTNFYDDQNRLYEQTGTYDDGRTWRTQYDVDNVQTWHRQVQIFDTADDHAWSERVLQYDSSDTLISHVVIDDVIV